MQDMSTDCLIDTQMLLPCVCFRRNEVNVLVSKQDAFLTLALGRGQWSGSRSSRFIFGENAHDWHWTGGGRVGKTTRCIQRR